MRIWYSMVILASLAKALRHDAMQLGLWDVGFSLAGELGLAKTRHFSSDWAVSLLSRLRKDPLYNNAQVGYSWFRYCTSVSSAVRARVSVIDSRVSRRCLRPLSRSTPFLLLNWRFSGERKETPLQTRSKPGGRLTGYPY